MGSHAVLHVVRVHDVRRPLTFMAVMCRVLAQCPPLETGQPHPQLSAPFRGKASPVPPGLPALDRQEIPTCV